MCGVVAMLPGVQGIVDDALETMRDRGPDRSASQQLGDCIVGVARLSITDLEYGHQPLLRGNKSLLIGFNGAIYNAAEIRSHLHNVVTETGNDAEIIGPLYERYGLNFAQHLEGMYAIVIYDLQRDRIVTANDPVGIKPLYVAQFEGKYIVASTLACFPREARTHVRRHLPGSVCTSSGEYRRIDHPFLTDTETERPLIEVLSESVAEQIPTEVSWGCFLSGGIDSSLIAALAQRRTDTSVTTICCGVDGSEDRLMAAALASELGFHHIDVPIREVELREAVKDVVRVTASYDPGIVMNGVGVYFAARAAHQAGIKVILSGEGADELFGGYDEHEASPIELLSAHLRFDQRLLGSSECLRLDRCAMAWSVETRVPYLSRKMMRLARALPPSLLIDNCAQPAIRKVALRQAAAGILPEWAATRRKLPFFEGAALPNMLFNLAEVEAANAPVPYIPAELKKFPNTDRLAAWLKLLWNEHYADFEDDWIALQNRGLVRRRFNAFLPPG